MLKIRALALTAAVGIATAATSAQAAVILTAGSEGLCSSAGCFAAANSYKQTYSAGAFSGPVSISALQLSKSVLGSNSDLAVKVSFQLADGTQVANWGSYTLASLGGDTVTIGGSAVDWDTARGDLVLKLDLVVPEKGGGGGGGFGGGGGGGSWGPGSLLGPDKPGMSGIGAGTSGALTTRLSPGDIAPMINVAVGVPEPSSWALMILGFGASGAILRNSRRRQLKLG